MRPSNKSRSRNKNNNNNRRNVGNVVNRVFDSSGPEGRVRGTPSQVIEKYQALARDAQLAGDRVAAENYLQHSEHFTRVLGEAQRVQAERMTEQRVQQTQNEPHRTQQQQPQVPVQADGGNNASGNGFTTMEDQGTADAAGGLVDTPESTAQPQQQRRNRPTRKARTVEDEQPAQNDTSPASPPDTAAE